MRRAGGSLESVRRISTVEEQLGVVFPSQLPSVGTGDLDPAVVLHAIDAAGLTLAVQRVPGRLRRKIELVPLHVRILRPMVGVNVAAVLPASQVIANRYYHIGRSGDFERQVPFPAVGVHNLELALRNR